MPIQFINGKCHIKKQKRCKTALSSYYACISRDLLLMPSGSDTHIYTTMFTDETISRNQVRMGLWSMHAWFNKHLEYGLISVILYGKNFSVIKLWRIWQIKVKLFLPSFIKYAHEQSLVL